MHTLKSKFFIGMEVAALIFQLLTRLEAKEMLNHSLYWTAQQKKVM